MERPAIGLTVRHPSTDDAEALALLMLDTYTGTIDFDETDTLDDARDEVRGYFSGEPMLEYSFLATDADVPVAAVLVSRYDGSPMIGYVMTAAAHKGRGLATAITRLAVASLYAAGEPRVQLWVTRGNTNAERIYDSLGFRDA